MRLIVTTCLCWLVFSHLGLEAEQARTPREAAAEELDLNLVGNRFAPLEDADLDDAQRTMVRHILDGPRTAVSGPFNVLLRSPEMGDLAQALGAYVRFDSVLPAALREMAILMTAAHWRAEYAWYAHERAARTAGLEPTVIDAIGAHRRPSSLEADEAVLYDFCHELLNDRRVSDDTFAAAIDAFGERGVVDLTGTLGYYGLVSLVLNVDEHPLPEGATPRFEP